jgi:hypothetical protein
MYGAIANVWSVKRGHGGAADAARGVFQPFRENVTSCGVDTGRIRDDNDSDGEYYNSDYKMSERACPVFYALFVVECA